MMKDSWVVGILTLILAGIIVLLKTGSYDTLSAHVEIDTELEATARSETSARAMSWADSSPTPRSARRLGSASLPTFDDRFGVVLHSDSMSDDDYFLTAQGVNWYIDFDEAMSDVPDWANKVPFVQVPTNPEVWDSGQAETLESLADDQIADLGFLTRPQLQQMAQDSPGAYWQIFGEPNQYGHITGARFAPVFHYFWTHIKIGDPTAKIIGTSILNWDFTCLGCGGGALCEGVFRSGYQCGKVWFKEFIAAYESRYGEKPPVDVWAIDAYPLDWVNTPNSGQHAPIAIAQIEGLRQYLDTIPQYADTPIWITRVGVHVGYDGFQIDFSSGNIVPVGTYHWDKMNEYMIAVLDWLEANGTAYSIEKWFFNISWQEIVNPGSDGYMGIIFFDGPDSGAPLNSLGQAYRVRACAQVTCPEVQLPGPTPIPTATPVPSPIPIPTLATWGLVALGVGSSLVFSFRIYRRLSL